MNEGFPTYSKAAQKGEAGVNTISKIVSDTFGWIFKRNHQEHDFGIDGQIEVVSESGNVTSQMLAVQIKYGSSFFNEKNQWGYVYRGELKHFNYLSNYPIPVVIVICNPKTKEYLWVTFDVTQTTRTEKAWKITIPFENIFGSAKSNLLKLVYPVTDNLELLEGYWKVNNLLMESDYIHYVVDKDDIQDMDIKSPREFFDRLRSTKELAVSSQGNVEISFFGYDVDSRELFEIDEVRKYIKKLELNLPELLFFVRTKEPTHTLQTFMLCLTNVEIIGERGSFNGKHRVKYDNDKVTDFLMRQYPGLNQMTEWLGMTIDDNKRICYGVYNCMGISYED